MFKSLFRVWLFCVGCLPLNSETMDSLETWEFDIFAYSDDELTSLVSTMFERTGFLEIFEIERDHFLAFTEAINDNYLDNPYHNFHHATEVLQFIYKLVHDGVFEEKLSLDEQFCLMLAALGHDIAHPGRSASYHKLLLTEIFNRFGEVSTLEKYHTEVLLALLRDTAYEILHKLDSKKADAFIREMILATDMTFHVEILENIKNNKLNGSYRDGVLAIKCADLGQLIRPKQISEKWVTLLHKEQFLQREEEKEKGIVDGLTDQEFLLKQVQDQEVFVRRFAYPLYEELGRVFSDLSGLKKRLHSPFIP